MPMEITNCQVRIEEEDSIKYSYDRHYTEHPHPYREPINH